MGWVGDVKGHDGCIQEDGVLMIPYVLAYPLIPSFPPHFPWLSCLGAQRSRTFMSLVL